MNRTSVVAVIICSLALLFAAFTPQARADQANQATKLDFSQPVHIPGRTLAAGTYWFTIMRDNPDRNVVQVWDSSREHLLDTILTVPDYSRHTPSHTVIKFEERASNQPEALQAWFYPGDNYGHAFVYSETEARNIARHTGHPVLAMRDDIASNSSKPAKSVHDSSVTAMKNADITAINANGQKVDKSQAIQAEPQTQTASRH